MKKYATLDYYSFKVIDDYRICPAGDYTEVGNRVFENYCIFEDNCVFGDKVVFGYGNKFGCNCTFGNECCFSSETEFGVRCIFGEYNQFRPHCRFEPFCEFAKDCVFEDGTQFKFSCIFKDDSKFGNNCSFFDSCSFGDNCFFGDSCVYRNATFGMKCSYESGRVKNGRLIELRGITNCVSEICLYKDMSNKLFLRFGRSTFGDIDFYEKFFARYGKNEPYEKTVLWLLQEGNNLFSK